MRMDSWPKFSLAPISNQQSPRPLAKRIEAMDRAGVDLGNVSSLNIET